MSNLYVKAQQLSVPRATDGQFTALRATRDGAPIVLPWFQALVLEGRVFEIIGPEALTTTTSGMTLLALASFGDDDATLYADIPDGTCGIPLEVQLSVQVTGAAICHFWAFITDTLLGTGGTETACTIRNLNRATPVSSGATAAHTADTEVDHVTGAEVNLFRNVTTFDVDAAVGFDPNRRWSAADSGIAPVVVDGGSIVANIVQATSGTGWGQVIWAEVTESAIV